MNQSTTYQTASAVEGESPAAAAVVVATEVQTAGEGQESAQYRHRKIRYQLQESKNGPSA